jgi:hypothetical protein
MGQAPTGMRMVSDARPMVVGGMLMGASQPVQPPVEQRKPGQRGPDCPGALRAPRKCKICSRQHCPGSWQRDKCNATGGA